MDKENDDSVIVNIYLYTYHLYFVSYLVNANMSTMYVSAVLRLTDIWINALLAKLSEASSYLKIEILQFLLYGSLFFFQNKYLSIFFMHMFLYIVILF